jgi:hypothetical protein
MFVILSDRTLSLSKDLHFLFVLCVRARLVGQGFNPDCRKRNNKCRALLRAA